MLALALLTSCSTSSHVNSDLEFDPNARFYVINYDDPLGLCDSIIKTIESYGLYAERVYKMSDIPDAKTVQGSGSGFFISPDVIVTNQHVVRDEESVVYYLNGVEHTATPLYVDESFDIAFLQADENDNPYFELGTKDDYELLSTIYALGYPLTGLLGNNIKVTSGEINSLSGFKGENESIQISAQIQPGNSGGPILNTGYKVIGVARSSLSDTYMLENQGAIAQDVNFAIKSDIVAFLGAGYIPEGGNYVSNLSEAMQATVKIDAGGTELIPVKQYALDFGYTYTFDVIHWTLTKMTINCYDVETGDRVGSAQFSGESINSAKGIAKSTMKELLNSMGYTKPDDDEE